MRTNWFGDPNQLAAQLAQLVESAAAVDELSQHAREAAVADLADYEAEATLNGTCRATHISTGGQARTAARLRPPGRVRSA